MEENGVNAVAQVVISQREQLVLLRPVDGILAMTVLNHQAKVKSSGIFREEIAGRRVQCRGVATGQHADQRLRLEEFDYGKYTDRYVEKLSELIRLKVEARRWCRRPTPRRRRSSTSWKR